MPSAPVPYPFARPPHPYLTPFARPPHPYLTPFARPPHPYLTPFARPPHPYLTPFARPPHPYLTPFARPPHPYLTPKHWPSSTAPQTGVWHDHILTTFTWVPEITVSLLLNLDNNKHVICMWVEIRRCWFKKQHVSRLIFGFRHTPSLKGIDVEHNIKHEGTHECIIWLIQDARNVFCVTLFGLCITPSKCSMHNQQLMFHQWRCAM